MSKAKAAVPLKAKLAAPAAAVPRKSSVEDDDSRKRAAAPAAAASGSKKPMAQMSEAEMRDEMKRMMAASNKKPAAAPAPASPPATMPATTALKAPAKLAASAQPLSPPIKSTAAPKSPVVATIKPGAPPPLKPLDHVPTEQPAVVSKQPAAAAPQPAKPALAAITKQQAPTPAKAAVEEKEEEDDEEDYYDEDFDEEAATIDEEEPEPDPQPVPALPAAPKLTSPNSRIRTLNPSPTPSSTFMPPTPRLAQLVSTVQDHITQEDMPLSARSAVSNWQSPRTVTLPPGPTKARQASGQGVVEEVRRVVLPSAKQVKAGLTRAEDVKRLKRAAWVLQRVERVEEAFELFSLQPSSQYDVWMREVGRGDKRNAGCQYSDDWRDEEVQTDPTQAEDEDTQAPEDLFVTRQTVRESEKREDGEDADAAAEEKKKRESKGDNLGTRLNWVHAASQLIEALLEENAQLAASTSSEQAAAAGVSTRYPHLRTPTASLSSLVLGQFSITPPPIFGPRQPRAVHFSAYQPDQLIIALSPIQPPLPTAETAQYQGLAHCSLLLLYDLSAPSSVPFPSKVLYCQGSVSCLGVEGGRGWCVVAGLEEGSVCVWDLRETDALHRRWQGSIEGVKQPPVLRHASFTSDGPFVNAGGEKLNHTTAVTAIRFVTASTRQPPTAVDPTNQSQVGDGATTASTSSSARSFDIFSLSSSTGNDFSFVSLDANGMLISWSAIEARDASLAGSDIDLTLAIGSTLKLARTHAKQHNQVPLPVAASSDKGDGQPLNTGSAHALQLCGGDTDEYVVALSGGRLCREKRYGGRSAPGRYSLLPVVGGEAEDAAADSVDGEGGLDANGADEVTCIASHPTCDEYFVAGYRSGLIALYSLQSSIALQLFFPASTTSSAITALHWHPTSPATIVSLTAASTLTVHNLLTQDSNEVQLSGVEGVEVGKGGRAGWMAAVCIGSGAAGANGRVDVYGLKGSEGRDVEEEREAVRDYLHRLS